MQKRKSVNVLKILKSLNCSLKVQWFIWHCYACPWCGESNQLTSSCLERATALRASVWQDAPSGPVEWKWRGKAEASQAGRCPQVPPSLSLPSISPPLPSWLWRLTWQPGAKRQTGKGTDWQKGRTTQLPPFRPNAAHASPPLWELEREIKVSKDLPGDLSSTYFWQSEKPWI